MSFRHLSVSIVFFACLVATTLAAATWEGPCPPNFQLGTVSNPSDFPFHEAITLVNFTLDNTWRTIARGCVSQSTINPPQSYLNLDSNRSVNALLRGFIAFNDQAAVVGTHYEVRFMNGTTNYGWYVRTIKPGMPQNEHFFSTIQGLPAGTYPIELQARVIEPGRVLQSSQQYLTLTGMPTTYPSAQSVSAGSYTITQTWSSDVTSTLTFTNSTPIDIYPSAYVEVNSAQASDIVSFGFQLDGESPSRRTSNVLVNVGGSSIREGINIADHLENVPPSLPGVSHTLKLWAVSRTQPVTVSFRQIEFASLPTAAADVRNPIFAQSGTLTNVVDINPFNQGTEQPYCCADPGNGYWQKLAEFDLPPATGGFNYTGEGYIELLGHDPGYTNPYAQIAVDVFDPNNPTNPATTTDMHMVSVYIPDVVYNAAAPQTSGQVYFFIDALRWGNANGNRVRLWIRKVVNSGGAYGTFHVGKRYMSVKLTPGDIGGYISPNP